MKELSLNILDIAMNSVKAGAKDVEISLTENGNLLTLKIADNGCGMDGEQLKAVTDPFFTTRTTRRVGMGIPLLKLAAEQTGGTFDISSSVAPENHGTVTTAEFYTDHIDFAPIGDVVSTVVTLIQGSPAIHWHFSHTGNGREIDLDTAEIVAVLGDVPLDNPDVLTWIRQSLTEEYNQ